MSVARFLCRSYHQWRVADRRELDSERRSHECIIRYAVSYVCTRCGATRNETETSSEYDGA